jgi:hypothetical protein
MEFCVESQRERERKHMNQRIIELQLAAKITIYYDCFSLIIILSNNVVSFVLPTALEKRKEDYSTPSITNTACWLVVFFT